MRGVRVGSAVLDGEVTGRNWRLALEMMSGHDEVIRGIGQLAEVLSHCIAAAALVTSARRARQLDRAIFTGRIMLLGVDSTARIT